jgi:glycosyltransferase involved in cell wall biosynthesis
LDHLRDSGHQALVVGPDNGVVFSLKTWLMETTYAGFPVRGTAGIPLFFYPELKWNFFSPITLQRIIEFNPDVLHFVDPILLGPQAIIAAEMFLSHVPRVSSYHTNIALYAKHFGYPVLSPAIWGLQRFLHNQCAAIMCPSPSTSRTLMDHNFPAEKIKIWHRGVDTDLFSQSKRRKEFRQMWHAEDKVVMLYVGRVSWEKNLKVLAQAYINLHRGRDVHLVITGDGPAKAELEAFFNEEKANVTFTGYLEGISMITADAGENLAATFASCDLFVFPSMSETFGQVVLEAQASGLPVVAFQAEGVCDIIQDGRTGWLVPRSATEEVAFENAISAVLANPEKRLQARVEAVQWASKWRWSEAMEKAVETYREACT